MTEAEGRELYLLRRQFGISPSEALYALPAWEVDLLVNGLLAEMGGLPESSNADEPGQTLPRALPRSDPFDAPPGGLEKLL